ncbi:MAG: type IV secretory system conjugative DNA transfer family protein, partial [Ruthenibacterium sp.]
GSGKTRFFIKPNLMQANCSYIVCDPKGETYRAVGGLLEAEGYEVIIFNLVDMAHSDCYNPFLYLHSDTDVIKLVTNLIANTTPKKSQTNDPFWDKAETALLTAFILYLVHEATPEEQNFATVMFMIDNAAAREEDENYKSPVDLLFDDLERVDPEHIAVKEYKVFKQASGKTAKSILVSAAVRLAAFNLPELANITGRDDMDLGALGDRKRVIFAVIPDNDTSFNYLVGMLYSQAFQELYFAADNRYGGRLPMPVRVLMDEFANGATRS